MSKVRAQAVLILIILSIIWGSSFVLMKKGLLVYSPFQVASLRIFIAGIIFLPYLVYKYKEITKLKYIILFAILEVGLPPYLYTIAQKEAIDSSTAGILNSLTPLFTLLAGAFIFKIKNTWMQALGVALGLAGAVYLVFFKEGSLDSINLTNSVGLLIVLATILYGIGGNVLKEYLQEVPGAVITAASFVAMSIPAGIYLFSTDFLSVPLSEPANFQAMMYIVVLSVAGSAFAILLFSVLIKKSSALFGSFVTYLIPFVAIFWGFLDGESIELAHFVCLLIILSGIYLANKGEKEKSSQHIALNE